VIRSILGGMKASDHTCRTRRAPPRACERGQRLLGWSLLVANDARCTVRPTSPIRHILIVGVVCVALNSCLSLDTGPGLHISQSVAASGEALATMSNAIGGNRAVVVTGRIVGKLPCDVVGGDLKEVGGGDLRLMIKLEADRGCNGIPPTTWTYLANIVNVEAGTRAVRVEHSFVGIEGETGVVLDTVVQVN